MLIYSHGKYISQKRLVYRPRQPFDVRFIVCEQFNDEIRSHNSRVLAMQLIVTDRQLPDGMYEQYLIEPEND